MMSAATHTTTNTIDTPTVELATPPELDDPCSVAAGRKGGREGGREGGRGVQRRLRRPGKEGTMIVYIGTVRLKSEQGNTTNVNMYVVWSNAKYKYNCE